MDERLALDSVPLATEDGADVSDLLRKLPFGIHSSALPTSISAHQPVSFENTAFGKSFSRHLKEHTDILEYSWDNNYQRSSSSSLESSISYGALQDGITTEKEKKFAKHSENEFEEDFVPLYSEFESMYARNCYMRVRDVFERPISSVPGATVKLLDRFSDDYNWTFKFPGTETEVINVGSYNYLGFAETDGLCAKEATAIIDEQGLSTCCTIQQLGFSKAQRDLELLMAKFLGVEDAICFSMGFATNSLNTPCLADEDTVIISDQFNHASLILGSRMSEATVRIFKHNDMADLEKTIRNSIAYGNPKKNKPFKKILIVVEGIYSMEGSICNLPAIIALKKKYGAYIYLDEAHSIGAMGPHGRGVVDYWGCDPYDVDILMGTFTKSFGSSGGYIAGAKRVINHIRVHSAATMYALPMSPPVVQQIISSMNVIMGLDGTNDGEMRRQRLRRNTHYFRKHLKRMGCIVYGSDDSPVVPIMLYYPTKCGFWGREMLKRRVGVVVVSFPATHMTESRLRICLSAAHTKEMLDHVLNAIKEVADLSNVLSSRTKKKYASMEIEW